jgi:hypothetical protein
MNPRTAARNDYTLGFYCRVTLLLLLLQLCSGGDGDVDGDGIMRDVSSCKNSPRFTATGGGGGGGD